MTDLAITGNRGQLGRSLERAAAARGLATVGADIDTLDITDADAVAAWVSEHRPRAVVNCAAYTAVDACETHEAEALAVNATAVGHLAAACREHDALLVHVSTDYVFAGSATTPYREDDPVAPRTAYGRTKLEGERRAAEAPRHLIVRTAWLYGHGGRNFIEAIRRQVDGGAESLRVVADQRGCPTLSDDLAAAILDLIAAGATGTVHAVNAGETTWHGLASEIVRRLDAAIPVLPVTTAEYPLPAPRPAYSVLDTSRLERLIGRPMPRWEDALGRYLEGPCAG